MDTNITYVDGYVEIYARTRDVLKDFLYLQMISEKNAFYTTTINNLPNTNNFLDYPTHYIDDVIKSCKDNESDTYYKIRVQLSGNGHLTFKNNMEWFFTNPLIMVYSQNSSLAPKLKEIEKLQEKLRNETFGAYFEINEYDDNNITIGYYLAKYKDNDTKLTTCGETIHPFNAENCQKYDVFSSEAYDAEYALNHFNEFLELLRNEMVSTSNEKEIYQEMLNDQDKLKEVLANMEPKVYYDFNEFMCNFTYKIWIYTR
jgi:hypothetical protein